MLATPFFEPYPTWAESADRRGNLSLFKYVTPNEDPAAVHNERLVELARDTLKDAEGLVVPLRIRFEVGDPVCSRSSLAARVGPLGAGWLRGLYAHSRPRGWEGRFKHAIRDPLLLFATQLPREAVLALDERSLAWPADLRRRWTYAAAVGAIGGYVF